MSKFNWYVVQTNVRAENKVNERMNKSGYQTYLPLLSTIKIWSDRKKKVKVPLIPSTVFVYSTHADLKKIYDIQGVSSILKLLNKPAIVHDYEINNMQILLKQNTVNKYKTEPRISGGETIKVTRGPFEGLIALAIETDNEFRVVAQVESLGSGFSLKIPRSYVRKI